jgi:hypothetical protein
MSDAPEPKIVKLHDRFPQVREPLKARASVLFKEACASPPDEVLHTEVLRISRNISTLAKALSRAIVKPSSAVGALAVIEDDLDELFWGVLRMERQLERRRQRQLNEYRRRRKAGKAKARDDRRLPQRLE